MTILELMEKLKKMKHKDKEVVIVGEDAQVFTIDFIDESILQDDLLI